MAAVTPSGSAGGIVEITNSAIAPANQFSVSSVPVAPGVKSAFFFPDGCTNIIWRVRQPGIEVRFFSDTQAVGYYTTTNYSSGSVNTKGVSFCWESDVPCDIEISYWGLAGAVEYEAIPKPISETLTITSLNVQNKTIELTIPPNLSYNMSITPREGCRQFIGSDFIVQERIVSWDNLGLDGLLVEGDVVQIDYFY